MKKNNMDSKRIVMSPYQIFSFHSHIRLPWNMGKLVRTELTTLEPTLAHGFVTWNGTYPLKT